MKKTYRAALALLALTSALVSLPASAQLGPAGVPGAPGLVTPPAVVKTNPPPETTPTRSERKAAVKPAVKKHPAKTKAAANNCRKAADPASCELHAKARKTCHEQTGETHRQCLRDNLAPGK